MDNREHRYGIPEKRSLIFHQPRCNQTTCQLCQQHYIGPDCYQFLTKVPENNSVQLIRLPGHWIEGYKVTGKLPKTGFQHPLI
jgi:hypothetical protein